MPKPYVCPCCKGQLQATAKVWLDIDEDGKLSEPTPSLTGDYEEVDVYCANDCFHLTDYTPPEPDDAEGWEELLRAAKEAAGEDEEEGAS